MSATGQLHGRLRAVSRVRCHAGKETLRTYATRWERIQVSDEGPRSFRIGRGVRYWHNEVTTCLQSQATDPLPHESSASQRLGRTRHVATSPPGRSLPWKHKGKARDDVMKLQAIHKTSKALLETTEPRQTGTRQALEVKVMASIERRQIRGQERFLGEAEETLDSRQGK